MAITLARLCVDAETTYGMKLIAGAAGVDNLVRWVHMIEDREVPEFLHGDELVFTTGIAMNGPNWLLEFVHGAHNTCAAGLVLNLGPYIRSVPQEVVDFCEQRNLPLFTVPWEIHLIDITYDFCHRIIASEEVEVGLASAVKNLIFEPFDEKAYRPTLERRGFHANNAYCVVVFEPVNFIDTDDTDMHSLQFRANWLLNRTAKLFSLFILDKRLIAVLQDFTETQIREFIESLQQTYETRYTDKKIPAGVSITGAGYSFISDGYRKAISALKVARAHMEDCAFYRDLGIYKLLISVDDTQVLKEAYSETLAPLEDFDLRNGTDYMETLRCYLEHDSSVQEVARLTFVHRNTINYKIKRIREILKTDFGRESRIKIMLAFYIKDLL